MYHPEQSKQFDKLISDLRKQHEQARAMEERRNSNKTSTKKRKASLTFHQMSLLKQVKGWKVKMFDEDPGATLLEGSYEQPEVDGYFEILQSAVDLGPHPPVERIQQALASDMKWGSLDIFYLASVCGLFSLVIAYAARAELREHERWQVRGRETRAKYKAACKALTDAENEADRWNRLLAAHGREALQLAT